MDLSATSTSESSNIGPVMARGGLPPFLAGALGTATPPRGPGMPGLTSHLLLRSAMNDNRNMSDPAFVSASSPAAMLAQQQLGLGPLTPGRPAIQFGSVGGPPLMYNSPDPPATDFCRNPEGPMEARLSGPQISEMAAPAFVPVPARQEPELSSRHSVGNRKKRTPRVKKDANTKEPKKPRSKKRAASLKKPPPGSLKRDAPAEDDPQDDPESGPSCCICLSKPKAADVARINGCDHLFCFECIETWAERQNTCPLCLVRFTKIERVDKKRKADAEKVRNTKRVKRKDQRSDMGPGIALEGLLERVAPHGSIPHNRTFARLIFASIDATNPLFSTSASARAMLPRGGHYAADILSTSDTEDDDEVESFFGSAVGPASISLLPPGVPISGGFVGGISLVGTGEVPGLRHLPFSRLAMPPSRSYATNGNDVNAGRGAENPLHIDDSEDEDGDDSEVVVTHVSRPPGP